MVAEAIRTARAARAVGEILVRGDSAYGNSAVISACLWGGARFSFMLINCDIIDASGKLAARATSSFLMLPGRFWEHPVHVVDALQEAANSSLWRTSAQA